ncbi:type I-C CRISPR-associated protein Cas5c [Streptomyces sp. ADI95-17]|uniref:type I-C CRISPR-associated protein Cas5c n=1 Tax=Streptomyces sp. ADI95-17 TaxID=1522759 RepID=UPI000FC364C0|nr:type I-C CRISPR-associated protein Cas5c [Streptomyces sp. ADI95-17]RPK55908.1 CRISPR-associated protein Cas5 [Streptomyces sp. ADI95-17]
MRTTVPAAGRLGRGNEGWAFPDLVVEVWGEVACFTRPELKAERVSYQVMTPSAARGVLEAIFWKPQFHYVVRKIEVLRPVSWMRVRRNEVKSVISAQEVRKLQSDWRYRYDVETDRDQRSTLALRDVRYRIHTQIVVDPEALAGSAKYPPASEEKYREQLRRRVERGACFSEPFLGCREFSASFGKPDPRQRVVEFSEELGVMLHSIAYGPQGERYQWFRASVVDGVLEVPEEPLPDDAVAMPLAAWRADGAGG